MITLEKVSKSNYLDCIRLELFPGQEQFLASNAVSIAQSRFEPHYQTRAICEDDKVVGFLAYCHEDDPEDLELYWLFRFMIDKNNQGRGIASDVLKLLVAEVRQLGGKRLCTMFKPGNTNADSAYKKFGFSEVGVLDDGDIHLEIAVI